MNSILKHENFVVATTYTPDEYPGGLTLSTVLTR